MNRCLICLEKKEESLISKKVCNKCLAKFKRIEKRIVVLGVETLILYEYDDFFKELLYRYKGCYDYLLKDAFINDYLHILKQKYKNRKVIVAPSYIQEDRKRGFNHVYEIAKCLKLEIVDCLFKSENYKQSSVDYNKRNQVQKIIKIDINKINSKDKILIIDDVTTSLSTLKSIIHLLPTNIDKKALILASNCRFMENEKN